MIIFWFLLLLTFVGTIYVMPHSLRKLEEADYVSRDMYKSEQPLVATNAGIIVLFTSYISISILPLVVRLIDTFTPLEGEVSDLSEINLAFLLVVSIYALYGLVDDLVDINRKMKLVLPIVFGYPLISVIHPETIWIPMFGDVDLDVIIWSFTGGDLFKVLVIPVYIMVVANLVNMHSGYNGLQSGLSILLLTTLIVKSWQDGILDNIMPVGAFIGAMVALWWFNKYPSRAFEGNIGSMLFGSVIGTVIVIQEFWWFGFFILIPHTINFLLWIFWLTMMILYPKEYLKSGGTHRKFGRVRKDGTLEVPNRLTLKWIPNYYWRINEKKSTNIAYLTTIFFCILGLIIF